MEKEKEKERKAAQVKAKTAEREQVMMSREAHRQAIMLGSSWLQDAPPPHATARSSAEGAGDFQPDSHSSSAATSSLDAHDRLHEADREHLRQLDSTYGTSLVKERRNSIQERDAAEALKRNMGDAVRPSMLYPSNPPVEPPPRESTRRPSPNAPRDSVTLVAKLQAKMRTKMQGNPPHTAPSPPPIRVQMLEAVNPSANANAEWWAEKAEWRAELARAAAERAALRHRLNETQYARLSNRSSTFETKVNEPFRSSEVVGMHQVDDRLSSSIDAYLKQEGVRSNWKEAPPLAHLLQSSGDAAPAAADADDERRRQSARFYRNQLAAAGLRPTPPSPSRRSAHARPSPPHHPADRDRLRAGYGYASSFQIPAGGTARSHACAQREAYPNSSMGARDSVSTAAARWPVRGRSTDPELRQRRYEVVLRDPGALVRRGVELHTPALYVLPYLTNFEVSERVVGERGVARLRLGDGTGWVSERQAGGDGRLIVRALS
jgi:hypothetical protein